MGCEWVEGEKRRAGDGAQCKNAERLTAARSPGEQRGSLASHALNGGEGEQALSAKHCKGAETLAVLAKHAAATYRAGHKDATWMGSGISGTTEFVTPEACYTLIGGTKKQLESTTSHAGARTTAKQGISVASRMGPAPMETLHAIKKAREGNNFWARTAG